MRRHKGRHCTGKGGVRHRPQSEGHAAVKSVPSVHEGFKVCPLPSPLAGGGGELALRPAVWLPTEEGEYM